MSELTVESVAKIMADFIGHGMTEKCERHAQAIMPLIDTIERETAEKCVKIQSAMLHSEHDDLLKGIDAVSDHFKLGDD